MIKVMIRSSRLLTLNLSLRSFDMGQHAGHVDTVPVQVLQEDISIAPGQRTGLQVCRERSSRPRRR